MAAGKSMESTQTSRGKERTQEKNTEHPAISLLKAALRETAPLHPKDKIKGATWKAMQGLGFSSPQTNLPEIG